MTCRLLLLGSPLLLAAIAQGLCIKYGWLRRLKRPLDHGLTFRGKRVFGDHKTYRGLLVNVISCTLGTVILAWLQSRGYLPSWLLLLNYRQYRHVAGLLLGLGMTLGELPNSFIKRQLDIHPGARKKGLPGVVFFLFDQVDLAVGIWILLFFVIKPSLVLVLWSFVLTMVVHVTISSVGYLLGMRTTIV